MAEPHRGTPDGPADDPWTELRRLADEEEGLSRLLSDVMGRTHGLADGGTLGSLRREALER